ncbi:MAG: T9SS type A sorting domain-containing protein, partial [Flavobacteriales bacterium]
FISSNGISGTKKLSDAFHAIYVWDGTSYTGLTTGYIQPGQAFFVNSKVSSGTVSITTAMQSHQTSIPFYKTSTPSLNLSVSNGLSTKKTQLNYFNDKTNGLDPGFDIGMFNGVASDLSIYTHLIENNEGIALGRQALAISEIESQIIPIGLKAEAGKELTFSIEALNLPNGIEVYLEDRATNTFSSLTDGDLKITLNEDVNGTGKYYLQLSSSTLSIDKDVLERVSMYTTTNANLRIVGLPIANTSVKLFNLIGKEVYRTSFKSNNIQNVSLSKLSKGLYIVQIQSEGSILNKKIILE